MAKLNRIYIIGTGGSGKTYLAEILSKKLNIPSFELDSIRYPNNRDSLGETELKNKTREISAQENWIVDGIYVYWTKEFLEKADQIIWLDIPLHITITRILKRYVKRKIKGEDKFGLKNTLMYVRSFMTFYSETNPFYKETDSYERIHYVDVKNVLENYKEKTVIFKNKKEIRMYVNDSVLN